MAFLHREIGGGMVCDVGSGFSTREPCGKLSSTIEHIKLRLDDELKGPEHYIFLGLSTGEL
jgi:hypothetical protein